jgi:hypothetical protein
MSLSAQATILRERATHLRQLAVRIEQSGVMRLDVHAGDDTWRGARAELCVATLVHNQHQLHHAADDLRTHAYRLACQADEADLQALLDHGPAA